MRYLVFLLALTMLAPVTASAAPPVRVEWSREVWAGPLADVGGVAVADNGSAFVVGTARVGPGDTDLALVRLDRDGNVEWRRRLGGSRPDGGTAIAIAEGGDVVVTGTAKSPRVHGEKRHGRSDMLTARYSAGGVLQWVRLSGGCGPSFANDVTVLGGVTVVTGSHQGSDTPCRANPKAAWYAPLAAVVLAYSPDGDPLWRRSLQPPGGGDAVGAASVIDESGDVYVTGRTMGWFDDTSEHLFAARLDPAGVPAWQRTFLSTGEARGRDAVLTDDGMLVAGYAEAPNRRSMLATITRDGDLAQASFIGRPGRLYEPRALGVVDDAVIVVAGAVHVPGPDGARTARAWLAGYEPGGDLAWSLTRPEGELSAAIVDLDAGAGGRLVATGVREAPGDRSQDSIVVTSYVIG